MKIPFSRLYYFFMTKRYPVDIHVVFRIDNFAILYIYDILVTLSLSSFGIFPMKRVSLSVRLFNIRAGEQCKCLSVNILSPSTDCGRLHGGVKAKTHPCRFSRIQHTPV